VDGIRMVSRASKGVRVFNTSEGERVVSVEHIVGEPGVEGAEAGDGEEPENGAPEGGEGA
jgi:DNA gyrase subunit A